MTASDRGVQMPLLSVDRAMGVGVVGGTSIIP